MDIYILNEALQTIDVVDAYESLIWTDRYCEYGDFELYLNANSENVRKFLLNNYLWRPDTEHVMIIESIKTDTDAENGAHLTIGGRSLESLLLRRIIWPTVDMKGYLVGQIKKIFDRNIIDPTDPKRKINNFIYEESTDDIILNLQIDMQFTGDTVYYAINKICEKFHLGFRVILRDSNFVFQLYRGEDRSYAQNKNPYVVFSPSFDNMINSDYRETNENLKNITLVAGEEQASKRKSLEVGDKEASGLHRRELYTDARDLSSLDDNGNEISSDAYDKKLIRRGEEKLKENKAEKKFEGQVETTQMYRYGEHFFMGDIVQIENEFQMEYSSRIVEYIYSDSTSGIEAYPTFEILEEAEE